MNQCQVTSSQCTGDSSLCVTCRSSHLWLPAGKGEHWRWWRWARYLLGDHMLYHAIDAMQQVIITSLHGFGLIRISVLWEMWDFTYPTLIFHETRWDTESIIKSVSCLDDGGRCSKWSPCGAAHADWEHSEIDLLVREWWNLPWESKSRFDAADMWM